MIQDLIVALIVALTVFLVVRQWVKKKRIKCMEDGVSEDECFGCTLSHFCKQKKTPSH